MHTMYADVGHLSVLRRSLRSSVAPVLKKQVNIMAICCHLSNNY